MAKSPRLDWPLPDNSQGFTYEAFVDLVNEIDASVYATREDRQLVLMNGGNFSFNATSGVLSWSSSLEILSATHGILWTVAAGSVTLTDGALAYVNLVRGASVNTTVTISTGTRVPSTDAALLIAIRRNDRVYFRNAKVLIDGATSAIFSSSSGSTTLAGDVTGVSDSNTVSKIQSRTIDLSGELSVNDVIKWDGTKLVLGALGGSVTAVTVAVNGNATLTDPQANADLILFSGGLAEGATVSWPEAFTAPADGTRLLIANGQASAINVDLPGYGVIAIRPAEFVEFLWVDPAYVCLGQGIVLDGVKSHFVNGAGQLKDPRTVAPRTVDIDLTGLSDYEFQQSDADTDFILFTGTPTGTCTVHPATVATIANGQRWIMRNTSTEIVEVDIGGVTVAISPSKTVLIVYSGGEDAPSMVGGGLEGTASGATTPVVTTKAVAGVDIVLTNNETDVDQILLTGNPGATRLITLGTPTLGRKILIVNQSDAVQTVDLGGGAIVPLQTVGSGSSFEISYASGGWKAHGLSEPMLRLLGGDATKMLDATGAVVTALPSGVALGGVGVYASRPAAGNAGRVYVPTDGGIEFVDDGLSWRPRIPGMGLGYEPPAAAGWTTGGHTSATLVDAQGTLLLTAANSAGTLAIDYAYRAFSSLFIYEAVLQREPDEPGALMGLFLRLSTGSRLTLSFPLDSAPTVVGKEVWSADNNRSAFDYSTKCPVSMEKFIACRVRVSGGALVWEVSSGGDRWFPVSGVGSNPAGWTDPTNVTGVGFFASPINGDHSVRLVSWNVRS